MGRNLLAGGGQAATGGKNLLADDGAMPAVSRFKNVPQDQLEAAVDQARVDRHKAAYDAMPFWKRNLVNIFDAGNFMTRGATAGLIEKGAAAARAPFTDKTYQQELDAQRAITQGSVDRQGASGQALGEVTGGVMAFKGIPQYGTGPISRAAQGALEGAGFGGASAYANDENVLRGAGMGAALGGGGSVLVDTVAKVGKPFSDALVSFATDPTTRSHRIVMDAIQRSGLSKDQIETAIRDLGTPGALVDALGKYGSDIARATANISTKAKQAATEFVGGRNLDQPVRIAGAAEKASGLAEGSRKSVDDLISDAYAARKPAIDQAYQAARDKGAVLPTEGFREIFATPAGRDAMKAAQTTLKNRAPQRGEADVSMLEILDQAKRELDSMATSAYSRGEKQAGETYSGLGRTLRERIDTAMSGGEYEAARKLRQQAYQEGEAIRLGGDLSKRNKPINVSEQVAKVTPENRGALKQGYGAGTAQDLLNQKGGGEGVLNSLNTPLAREAASSVLGNDASILRDQLARERTMAVSNKELLGGSTTAGQLQKIAEFTGSAGVGAGLATAADIYNRGLSWDTLKSAAAGAAGGAGLRYGRGVAARRAEATAPEVMELLLGKQVPQMPAAQAVSPFGWRTALPTRNDLVRTLIVGGGR